MQGRLHQVVENGFGRGIDHLQSLQVVPVPCDELGQRSEKLLGPQHFEQELIVPLQSHALHDVQVQQLGGQLAAPAASRCES